MRDTIHIPPKYEDIYYNYWKQYFWNQKKYAM